MFCQNKLLTASVKDNITCSGTKLLFVVFSALSFFLSFCIMLWLHYINLIFFSYWGGDWMNHSRFIPPSTEFYYFRFINLSYCANIAPGSLHFSPNIVVVLEADWEKVKVQCTLIRTSGDITVYHRMPACVWTVGRT